MKDTNIILLGIAIILFSISIGMDNIIVLFVSIIWLITALVGYLKNSKRE